MMTICARPLREGFLFLLFSLVTATGATAQTFTDNSFTAGWSTVVHHQNPSSPLVTVTASTFPASSPNSRRLYHGYYTGMDSYARHMNVLQTYAPSSGRISTIQFRYVVRADPINVGYAPLILQGDQYYSRPLNNVPRTATSYDLVLTADNFRLVLPDGRLDETKHPDFSCTGAPITFGYYSSNRDPLPQAGNPIGTVSFLSSWRVDIDATPCPPTISPACPPLTWASIKDQVRLLQDGTIGADYGFWIIIGPPYAERVQAYVNYLHTVNPAITTFTVRWVITNQGRGTYPAGPAGPVVATEDSTWVCPTAGCPPNFPTGFATRRQFTPNRWYRITATPRLNSGLSFWPADCPPAVFEYNMREIP